MAQITIEVPDAAIPRIQAAFQEILGLDQLATLADVKSYIVADLKAITFNTERRLGRDAVADPPPVDYT